MHQTVRSSAARMPPNKRSQARSPPTRYSELLALGRLARRPQELVERAVNASSSRSNSAASSSSTLGGPAARARHSSSAAASALAATVTATAAAVGSRVHATPAAYAALPSTARPQSAYHTWYV